MTRRRRPGPRPKPETERLTRVVALRVTRAEADGFASVARGEHLSVAAWARRRLLQSFEWEIRAEAAETRQAELETKVRALSEAVESLRRDVGALTGGKR
jgi:hypothetical protein